MKKAMIDRQRTIVAYGQSAEVAQPGEGAFDNPSPLVTTQCATILRGWFAPTLAVRDDRFDTAATQLFAQPIAIVAAIHDHALGFLSRPPRPMLPPYADRRERFLDERDFRGGCRVKVVSQRNTLAVDHHHPLRPLTPLGFSDSVAPFFAGAKLPSINDSLHFSCWCSFNSLRNARQISSQTSCSSQSRSLRQQVEGDGNSAGKSHQRARCAESTRCLPTLCGRRQAVVRPVGVSVVSGARAGSFPIALRSTADRIAPSALPRRCCLELSPIFGKVTITVLVGCTRF